LVGDLKHIILAAKKKDAAAERHLFNMLAPTIFQICRRYAVDDSQAKDYLQDCFIHIFDKLEKYNPELNGSKSWFTKLSVNLILSKLRYNKNRLKLEYPQELPQHELEEEHMEYISEKELIDCIRKLPDGYRTVINLYIFESLSHADISNLLQISESTSRSQYLRAKKMLKQIMIEKIPDLYERKLV
jgi:RNA polymerase sigma-70 factor (ECF subfamily)